MESKMRNILKFVGRLSVLFVCALSLSSIQIMADDKSEKGASSLEEKTPNSYPQDWLDQDVAYIITDEERAAFKRLTTNEALGLGVGPSKIVDFLKES